MYDILYKSSFMTQLSPFLTEGLKKTYRITDNGEYEIVLDVAKKFLITFSYTQKTNIIAQAVSTTGVKKGINPKENAVVLYEPTLNIIISNILGNVEIEIVEQ